MFEDHNLATFSLHIISQLGVDEGKPIGEWYGPNTVAQVLRCVALGRVLIDQVWQRDLFFIIIIFLQQGKKNIMA